MKRKNTVIFLQLVFSLHPKETTLKMADSFQMPGEFGMFFFDGPDAGSEVWKVVRWVCKKNGLYDAVEMIAVKYPFTAGVGRKNLAGGADQNEQAVELSARKLRLELLKLPKKVMMSVYGAEATRENPNPDPGNNSPLFEYLDIWGTNRDGIEADNDPYRDNRERDEDKAIVGDMTPQARMNLILRLIENAYASAMALIIGRYPITTLFDSYITEASKGNAGLALASVANGK